MVPVQKRVTAPTRCLNMSRGKNRPIFPSEVARTLLPSCITRVQRQNPALFCLRACVSLAVTRNLADMAKQHLNYIHMRKTDRQSFG